MTGLRPTKALLAASAAALALLVAGCGGEIDVDSEHREGAQLFYERCSGCHTFERANSYGSKPEDALAAGERTNGPNFNQRKVARDDALFAIRNGGYSGAIMPANIAVGEDAEKIADFIARYSGEKRGSSEDVQASGEQSD